MAVKTVTDENFDEAINIDNKLVAVYFKANWSGPCRMMKPMIENLSEEYEGRVDMLSMDVDGSGFIMSKYGVSTIPTIVLFKNGEVEEQLRGLMSPSQLSNKIEKHLY